MIKKYYSYSLLVLFLFVIDRFFKFFFLKNNDYSLEFIPGWLSAHLEINQGIAFGLPVNKVLIFILSSVIIFILFSFLIKVYSQSAWLFFSLSLIILGAISNLIDRWRYGFVIDYIDLNFFTVFNLADVIISTGIILIIINELFFKKRAGLEKG